MILFRKIKIALCFTLMFLSNLLVSQNLPNCIGVITSSNQIQSSNSSCYGNMDAEVSAYTVNANSPTIFYNVSFHFIMHPTQATTYSSAFNQSLLENDVNITVDSINARYQRCGYIPSYIIPPNPYRL